MFPEQRNIPPRPEPLRPHPDPLPFELTLPPIVHRAPSPRRPSPPRAAARSNHVPAMGLGGALLAQTRPVIHRRPSSVGRRVHYPLDVRNQHDYNERLHRVYENLEHARTALAELQAQQHRRREMLVELDDNPRQARYITRLGPRGTSPQPPPDYVPEYTHPKEKMSEGFTQHFAPPESTGSKADPLVLDEEEGRGGEGAEHLACAHCAQPLIVDAGEEKDDTKRAEKKIWALRCGHVYDGKCVHELIGPAPDLPSVEDAKPQTKEEAVEVLSAKGKGKRRAVDPGQTRRRSKRARKGAQPEPIVESRVYEKRWFCPVMGCARMHISRWKEDKWVQDKEHGAIPMYV